MRRRNLPPTAERMNHSVTPDGRYFVVRGRLWRGANPALTADRRAELTRDLMDARRAKGGAMRAGDAEASAAASQRVDVTKLALGQRGPVWWADSAPDWNRHLVWNTPYTQWFAALPDSENEQAGGQQGRSKR